VVYPKAITLPPSKLVNYVNSYTQQSPGPGFKSVKIVMEENTLWLIDPNGRHKFRPLSESEFFDEAFTGVRIHFTLNEKGQATSLTITGLGPDIDKEVFVVKN
jgi:hypothetical protein